MIRTAKRKQKERDLQEIALQLELLTDAVKEQNRLIRICTRQPEGKPARLMVGVYGAVEVIDM